jgi:cytidylate kinase
VNVRPEVPVITIDGPGGAGKGTVSARLAERLSWNWLESGRLYRWLGWQALQEQVNGEDEEALGRLIATIRLRPRAGGWGLEIEGAPIPEALADEAAADRASRLAGLPFVRRALLPVQRSCRQPPGLVTDGRDMGTVVFPDAVLKVFLTASVEARAARRLKQLNALGLYDSLRRLTREIEERDERDRNRSVSPLKPAPDAWIVDSTGLDAEQVVQKIWERWRAGSGVS